MKTLLHSIIFLFLTGTLFGQNEPYLKSIRQLTFSSMNFEKAGEAYFSPDQSSIIFQAVPKGENNYQMYVMNLEDGIPKMVSTGKGSCTCGYYHPTEKKIIFASSHEDLNPNNPVLLSPGKYVWDLTPYMNIYESETDGNSLKALTSGPAYHAECAYSPDGSEIVYASNEDGSMNLYVMNGDGTNVRQITHTSHCYNGGPFFSPDGQHIIFRSDRGETGYFQIFVIGVDGSNETQITDNNAVNWAPYWHPSGKWVAYTTSVHGHHQYEIYLVNIHTGAQARLTNNPSFDGLPVFNKTGDKLMWTSKRGKDGTCQIFIADFIIPPELN